MNYKMIGRYIGRILLVEAVFMLPALLISLVVRSHDAALGFLLSMAITAAAACVLLLLGHGARRVFYARDGLLCVALSWIAISVTGCLPFFLSREIPHFIDAFFETVSGFTTTGASILRQVEAMSKGLLYWRSFTHWLGGMGVLVFLLALGSHEGRGDGFALHLLRAESPGPTVGKLVPHLHDSAKILYLIYIALTVANILFLLFGGMSLFDAVCTAFGTAGTGGFGVKNDSIAGYSPYLQNVCTVFMLLFGVNFNCYYLLLLRQWRSVLRDEELRLYLGAALASTLLIAWNLRGFYGTVWDTLRHAAFQVSSIMTTTGFATTDFDQWPAFSRTVLLILMMLGASAGSTGGGFKCGRALLLFKNLLRSIRKSLHPNRVEIVRMNGRTVEERTLRDVNAYLAAYMVILIASVLLVSLDGLSLTTNLSAVLACFNNIGPGLELVGPTGNYAAYGVLSKLVLSFDMLAGRLEIFPILILFSKNSWKRM